MICSCCGCDVPSNYTVISEEKIFCKECASKFNTCLMCKLLESCEFRSNPDPMPQMVVQTIQKGNMTMQTQVMNPERIEKFCKTCDCYDEEAGCQKQRNVCSNYKERFFKEILK